MLKVNVPVFLLAFVLTVSGCSLLGPLVQGQLIDGDAPVELVYNGGFEEVDEEGIPVGFTPVLKEDTVVDVDSGRAKSGENSVRLKSNGVDAIRLIQSVKDLSGGVYRLSIWYQAEEKLSDYHVRVRTQAFAGSVSSRNKVLWQEEWILQEGDDTETSVRADNMIVEPKGDLPEDRSQWRELEVFFRFPDSADLLYLELYNRTGNGFVWYDDLSVVKVD